MVGARGQGQVRTMRPEAEGVAGAKSKRVYVYWGVALALLLAAGLFCWKVVVPAYCIVVAFICFWKIVPDVIAKLT